MDSLGTDLKVRRAKGPGGLGQVALAARTKRRLKRNTLVGTSPLQYTNTERKVNDASIVMKTTQKHETLDRIAYSVFVVRFIPTAFVVVRYFGLYTDQQV